ncbi:MAG: hypothetical protein KGJ02_03975 [Verrucomicrobiota bacterium]|nr:hypothetical protein [Verrucomicrobiota bacterium]
MKLIHTLTPLAEEEGVVLPLEISKRLFVPPKEVEQHFAQHHSTIRWLPNLLKAQDEVKEWLDVLEEKEPSAKMPTKVTLEEEKDFLSTPRQGETNTPFLSQKESREQEGRGESDEPRPKGPGFRRPDEKPTRDISREEEKPEVRSEGFFRRSPMAPLRRPIETTFKPFPASRFSNFSQPTRLEAPIMQPAHKAIEAVRTAIRFMANSMQLEQPRIDELQRALKKIKPLLEQLIQAVEVSSETAPVPHATQHRFVPSTTPFSPALRLLSPRRKEKKKRDKRRKDKESSEQFPSPF